MQFAIQENIPSKLAGIFLKNSWIRSAVAAAMLVGFLLVFQPFDYNLLSLPVKLKIVALVGIGTFLICVGHQWLSGALKQFIHKTLIRETILWLAVIVIASQLLFGYTIQTGINGFSWGGSLQYLYASAFISLIPILGLIGIRRLYKPSSRNSEDISKKTTIHIGDEHIVLNDLLFLKAEDNYVRIYEKNKPPRLIRGTISKVEKQINGHNQFMRIHRSHLINLQCIEGIQGNSKSLKVRLSGFDSLIPVARSKTKEFKRAVRTQNPPLSTT